MTNFQVIQGEINVKLYPCIAWALVWSVNEIFKVNLPWKIRIIVAIRSIRLTDSTWKELGIASECEGQVPQLNWSNLILIIGCPLESVFLVQVLLWCPLGQMATCFDQSIWKLELANLGWCLRRSPLNCLLCPLINPFSRNCSKIRFSNSSSDPPSIKRCSVR